MAQFGTLSSAQQTTFIAAQAATIRKVTYSVFLGGLGDVGQYIERIVTNAQLERQVEGGLRRGQFAIDTALLICSNEDDTFWSSGVSTVEEKTSVTIYAGFNGLNIPIFTGVVQVVRPASASDTVAITAMGFLGVMEELRVEGVQGSNTTVKAIAQDFAAQVGAAESIGGGQEIGTALDVNSLEPHSMLSGLEILSDGIFHVAWFDESGVLHLEERNWTNRVDWTYNDDNLVTVAPLAASLIINKVEVEYRDNWMASFKDTPSVNAYRERSRQLRRPFLNFIDVASATSGSTTEPLNENLEAVKFTSAATAGNIDGVAFKLGQSSGGGSIAAKIYSDDGGSPSEPNALFGTSETKYPSLFVDSGFAWEYFRFIEPVEISPSTVYWAALDLSAATGTVNAHVSAVTATGQHAINDGSWSVQNDKKMLHQIRSSPMAQRNSEDIVRRHSEPRNRFLLAMPGLPQNQINDEALVDVTIPYTVRGTFVIEGRRHIIDARRPGEAKFTTFDTVAQVSK